MEMRMRAWALQRMDYQERPRDLPGGPVVKTPHFHCRGHRFNPWSGT